MKISVVDLETDPFQYGQMIQPFVLGFYDGDKFISIWGQDCVERFVENFLRRCQTKLIVYAHNGGRFDFFWFLKYITGPAKIINNRIVQARIGNHELRDSYAIMPFPLEAYKKTEIDYSTFTAKLRDKHQEQIVSYLRDDCTDLYTLCVAFNEEFGSRLTIGGTAMGEVKARHAFEETSEGTDKEIRERFYFGGRNQVFRSGIIDGPIQIYDVNSMYPFVMKNMLHPISGSVTHGTKITDNTAFITLDGRNYGALPTRTKDGSLDFTRESGVFNTTIHEYQAAIDTGTFEVKKIIETFDYEHRSSFDTFVDDFYNKRMRAKKDNDAIRVLFYKLILNSGYGKFAQNPENYYDWAFAPIGTLPPRWHDCYEETCDTPCRDAWEPAFISANEYILWRKPVQTLTYYNVATGASITGAARSLLLRGLQHTRKPYYCDTDSIICGDELQGVVVDEKQLGAWKKELKKPGKTIAICGKKLYAVYDNKGNVLKKASKGAKLTGAEILKIAGGATVEYENPVPVFKWDGNVSFTKRRIRRT